ncbi:MAG: hypothetical protein J4400_04275 [Candidatus Aenigmarchaeota archaeon]|nr:hypothetical protein [Candidatus Aenigmarchaeota archaeon]
MVLEIILAAVLIAFGIIAILFSINEEVDDKQLVVVLLVGVASIVGGGWVILTHVTLWILLAKLAGLILAGLGVFLIIGFPDVEPDYQLRNMTNAGVFIGLVLLIIGAYLLFFYPV